MTHAAARTLPWSNPSTWLAIAAAAALLGLGLLAVLSPTTSSGIFGVGLADGDGLAFVQAMGGRNIGLSLLALTLIRLDLRSALAALLLFAALIACIDTYAVASHAGFAKAAKHFGYVVGLSAFGLWLLSRR
jgi:hypothetical protein